MLIILMQDYKDVIKEYVQTVNELRSSRKSMPPLAKRKKALDDKKAKRDNNEEEANSIESELNEVIDQIWGIQGDLLPSFESFANIGSEDDKDTEEEVKDDPIDEGEVEIQSDDTVDDTDSEGDTPDEEVDISGFDLSKIKFGKVEKDGFGRQKEVRVYIDKDGEEYDLGKLEQHRDSHDVWTPYNWVPEHDNLNLGEDGPDLGSNLTSAKKSLKRAVVNVGSGLTWDGKDIEDTAEEKDDDPAEEAIDEGDSGGDDSSDDVPAADDESEDDDDTGDAEPGEEPVVDEDGLPEEENLELTNGEGKVILNESDLFDMAGDPEFFESWIEDTIKPLANILGVSESEEGFQVSPRIRDILTKQFLTSGVINGPLLRALSSEDKDESDIKLYKDFLESTPGEQFSSLFNGNPANYLESFKDLFIDQSDSNAILTNVLSYKVPYMQILSIYLLLLLIHID